MKKLLVLFCFACTLAQAQFNPEAPWMRALHSEARQALKTPITFQETVDAFNNYWETRDPSIKGSGYKPFKRWEAYWKNFVKPDGTLPTASEHWNNYLELKQASTQKSFITDESDWQAVGPFTHSNTGSWSSGQGRVNVIVADTANTGVYYAGAPSGGFWTSTDSGNTWTTTTDFLPQIGVSGIAIDYGNPGTLYIATGDDDANDSVTIGVMKSEDNGLSWNTTGLHAGNTPASLNDIYVSANNSNIIWVASSSGVYKSVDAGLNWSNQNGTQGVNIRDIKIKPGDNNIIYAASSNRFYRSTDGGDSFTPITTTAPGLPLVNLSRYAIDVTASNPEVVYLLASNSSYGFRGIYKSVDSGLTFGTVATPGTVGDIFESPQSWFDMAFAVSDINENEIYTGVLNVWKGIVDGSGQATFTQINSWSAPASASYTHADIHFLRFFEGELFVGSDGGFYKSANGGLSFTDLTSGMQIGQFYRIAVSMRSSEKMVGGLQDNGGHAYSNGQWQNYYGADGMDTAIDPLNSDLFYGFIQNGSFLCISTTSGGSLDVGVSNPAGEYGNWITPLFMNSESELFAAYSRLYKLEDNNWVVVSPSFGANVDVMEIDDLNPDNIFVGLSNSLHKSTNRGLAFSSVYAFGSNITSIEVNTSDSSIIYVTTSGPSGGVFKSTDGGTSFADISNGLPAITKNSIKHQNMHPQNPLFLATSLGVYRYDDSSLVWELFNNNLPNVSVRDIEINIIDNIITAATFGRGIWQSSIPIELAGTDVKLLSVSDFGSQIDCDAIFSPELLIENNGLSTITSVDVLYTIDAVDADYTWTGSLVSEASTTIILPASELTTGVHTFSAVINTPNDTYFINNASENKSIIVNGIGEALVINRFETTDENLLVLDKGSSFQSWERGLPSGTVLNDVTNPTNQVYATNLTGDYNNNTKSYLYSECHDLTRILNPELQFDMAFQMEEEWDILYIEFSNDQGETWSILGSAIDQDWYNNSTLPGATCFNCPGAQWTGENAVLTPYQFDLEPYTNEMNFMIRFVFHSDQSVSQEGVMIDNLVITGSKVINENFEHFAIYPNPSAGQLNIRTKTNDPFSFTLFDITGKLLFQAENVNPNHNKHRLDLSTFASGVYLLNLYNAHTRITKRLIIN